MIQKARFNIYYSSRRTAEIVSDDLETLAEAQLFAEYLSIYSGQPRDAFFIVAEMQHDRP